MMHDLHSSGSLALPSEIYSGLTEDFSSCTVSDSQTLSTIQSHWEKFHYLLDPHTAIALSSFHQLALSPSTHHCVVATAHWSKFESAISQALSPDFVFPPLPPTIQRLQLLPSCTYQFPSRPLWASQLRQLIELYNN